MIEKTNIPNPYCTSDTISEIEIWSVLDDFYDCQDEVCAQILQKYGDEPFTIYASPSSYVAPYLANMLSAHSPSVKVVDRIWDLYGEEVDRYIYSVGSAFRRHYKDYAGARHKVLNFMDNMEPTEDVLFQFHHIKDDEMQKVIEQTIAQHDEKQGDNCLALNRRHVLIIDETLVSQKTIEQEIKSVASCYDPKSITVLCRYGLQSESEYKSFAAHAVINKDDGNDSPFPTDKYQVVVQNDNAILHPAQMHIHSKEDKWHIIVNLQNGKRWSVKDYGNRQPEDKFMDIQAQARQWLSMPSQLAMAGGMTNRELALGLWELNNRSAKLCRVGYFGKDMEFEVFVNKEDKSYVPHFHVRRWGHPDGVFETRVKLMTNEYLGRDSKSSQQLMRLDSGQCAMLAELMQKRSHSLRYRTNYDYAVGQWTLNNHRPAFHYGEPTPDYSTIYDVVEVRVNLSEYGNGKVSDDIIEHARKAVEEYLNK